MTSSGHRCRIAVIWAGRLRRAVSARLSAAIGGRLTLTVSEYTGAGYVSAGVRYNDLPQEPAVAVNVLSSGSSAAAPTVQFQSGTRLVRLTTNAVTHFVLFASSTAGSIASATESTIVPAGQISYHAVPAPNLGKIIAFST